MAVEGAAHGLLQPGDEIALIDGKVISTTYANTHAHIYFLVL